MCVSSCCWFSLSSVGRVWFPFLLIPELHNTFRGWCLGFKNVCLLMCECVCLSLSLSTFVHKRHLIFHSTTTMVSSCSPYKQTHPCLQMKTNIDEIKLGKEYLISELNVWIKLGFLYWIKHVGIGSMSSIWENRRQKTYSFFCALFSFAMCTLLHFLVFTFCPCICVILVFLFIIRLD